MSAPVRVAILDLYNGEPNQGMRCITDLLDRADGRHFGQAVETDVFETRLKGELPGMDYDVYLSTGGPGSPYDGEGKAWERDYFRWVDAVWNHNAAAAGADRKHVLFICHSFQMMVRHFALADVTERRTASFGIFPVHKTPAGRRDALLGHLPDPFYAADFRSWQAVEPDARRLRALGAAVLAKEKPRAHVPLERAVMAVRLSPELLGVQFHPEADPAGMRVHFAEPERRDGIVSKYGRDKYERIQHRMRDPRYLARTHRDFIPRFLQSAVANLRPEVARAA